MRIGAHDQRYDAVAEHIYNHAQIGTAWGKQCGGTMPQIVEPLMPLSDLCKCCPGCGKIGMM
jgi:hypothetical protein